jgi:hypothetical protein
MSQQNTQEYEKKLPLTELGKIGLEKYIRDEILEYSNYQEDNVQEQKLNMLKKMTAEFACNYFIEMLEEGTYEGDVEDLYSEDEDDKIDFIIDLVRENLIKNLNFMNPVADSEDELYILNKLYNNIIYRYLEDISIILHNCNPDFPILYPCCGESDDETHIEHFHVLEENTGEEEGEEGEEVEEVIQIQI